MSVNFIPRNDAAFDIWFHNFIQYVELKTSGDNPQWKHIPQDRIAGIKKAYERWHAALTPCLKPHTAVETQIKNAARKQEEPAARLFKKLYIDFEPDVADADRSALGLPLRDRPRGPAQGFVPDTIPEITVDTSMIRRLKFHFKDFGSENKAKPKGVHSMEIRWTALDSPPANTEDLTSSDSGTASPLTLNFSESERGKRIYYCGRWISKAGKKGPWGTIGQMIIP